VQSDAFDVMRKETVRRNDFPQAADFRPAVGQILRREFRHEVRRILRRAAAGKASAKHGANRRSENIMSISRS
jgi:hypothetical protein